MSSVVLVALQESMKICVAVGPLSVNWTTKHDSLLHIKESLKFACDVIAFILCRTHFHLRGTVVRSGRLLVLYLPSAGRLLAVCREWKEQPRRVWQSSNGGASWKSARSDVTWRLASVGAMEFQSQSTRHTQRIHWLLHFLIIFPLTSLALHKIYFKHMC